MYCKHCGKEIENETKFCPYCGKSQDNLTVTGSPQLDNFFNSKAGQIFRIISIPVIGLLMLISAIVGLIVANKSLWLIIACVLFIVIGISCIIQFVCGMVARKKGNKKTDK